MEDIKSFISDKDFCTIKFTIKLKHLRKLLSWFIHLPLASYCNFQLWKLIILSLICKWNITLSPIPPPLPHSPHSHCPTQLRSQETPTTIQRSKGKKKPGLWVLLQNTCTGWKRKIYSLECEKMYLMTGVLSKDLSQPVLQSCLIITLGIPSYP